MFYTILIILLFCIYAINYIVRYGRRLCKFYFAVDFTEFKINAQIFNNYQPDKFDFVLFYTKLFHLCLKSMNSKNQLLVLEFFKKNIMNRELFRELYSLYCQNLSQKQRNLLAETTPMGYFAPVILNDKDLIKIDGHIFCIGSLSFHEKNAKLKWNKSSTISSVIPLFVCYFFYLYFLGKLEEEEKNEFILYLDTGIKNIEKTLL